MNIIALLLFQIFIPIPSRIINEIRIIITRIILTSKNYHFYQCLQFKCFFRFELQFIFKLKLSSFFVYNYQFSQLQYLKLNRLLFIRHIPGIILHRNIQIIPLWKTMFATVTKLLSRKKFIKVLASTHSDIAL